MTWRVASIPHSCKQGRSTTRMQGKRSSQAELFCIPVFPLTTCVIWNKSLHLSGLSLPIYILRPGTLTGYQKEQAVWVRACNAWAPNSLHPIPAQAPSPSQARPQDGVEPGQGGPCLLWHGRGQLLGQVRAGPGGMGHWCQPWGQGRSSAEGRSASSWKLSQ